MKKKIMTKKIQKQKKRRYSFSSRKAIAADAGLTLERDPFSGHPYCLWFNSPSGSKEIWIRNLSEEFEAAYRELIKIKISEVCT